MIWISNSVNAKTEKEAKHTSGVCQKSAQKTMEKCCFRPRKLIAEAVAKANIIMSLAVCLINVKPVRTDFTKKSTTEIWNWVTEFKTVSHVKLVAMHQGSLSSHTLKSFHDSLAGLAILPFHQEILLTAMSSLDGMSIRIKCLTLVVEAYHLVSNSPSKV